MRLKLKCVVTNNKPTIIKNINRNKSYGHLNLDRRDNNRGFIK